MSAQQRDARSRGQMSTTTGSPALELAVARTRGRRPTAGPWETITSSGRSQPIRSHDRLHRARARPPSVTPGAELADQLARRRPWRRRRPAGRAGCRRAAARVLARRRAHEDAPVDAAARSRRRAGGRPRRAGSRAARRARSMPPPAQRAQRELHRQRRAASTPWRDQLVGAQRARVERPRRRGRGPCRASRTLDRRDPAAVRLGVAGTGRTIPSRDGVEEVGRRGRARRRAAGRQSWGSSSRASTSGTWRM